VLPSCSKEPVTSGIAGEWIWIESIGGWGTFTPKILGYNETLIIDDYFFRRFYNDSLIQEVQYDLLIRTDSVTGNSHFLRFESGYEQLIELTEDELILSDFHIIDGYTHYYSRK
jgi:hypothetical protein